MAKNLSTYELKGDAHKIFLSPFYPFLLYAGKHHLHLYHLYTIRYEGKSASPSIQSPFTQNKTKFPTFPSTRIKSFIPLDTTFS